MRDFSRQGFLGQAQKHVLSAIKIGVVGAGGGGSHHAQQLGHIGFRNLLFVDPDRVEASNLNRLVGASRWDAIVRRAKVNIAARTVRRLGFGARIQKRHCTFQDALEELKSCDVILGAVDGYNQRAQLEAFCRRFLIPYIDIGMDVCRLDDGTFLMSGQVITSIPGGPCMRCCNFITDTRLEEEARLYGEAGIRPQVVWPNGLLASAAIGELMSLVLPWHKRSGNFNFLEYDGNRNTLKPSAHVAALQGMSCPHHPLTSVGDPFFDIHTQPAKSLPWWKSLARALMPKRSLC